MASFPKEISAEAVATQAGQSRFENSKVELYIFTLGELATMFEVSITPFLKLDDINEDLKLTYIKN